MAAGGDGNDEDKEDLRLKMTGISTSAGLRPAAMTSSLSSGFGIVDASSQSVASPYPEETKGGSKASGNEQKSSNLSDNVQSVQSYVI